MKFLCFNFGSSKKEIPAPALAEPVHEKEVEGSSAAASTKVGEPEEKENAVPIAAEAGDSKLLYKNLSHPVDFTKAFESTENIAGKSVLVTGGANGLGLGFTKGLAKAGAYVTIADWAEEQGKKVAEELVAEGLHIQFVQTDVTDWDSLVNSFKQAIAFSPTKTVDLVIANAGIAAMEIIYSPHEPAPQTAEDLPPKPTFKTIDVNLVGVLQTVKLALHYFRLPGENPLPGRKQLILISSMGGYTEMPGATLYNSSKFAVRGIFKSLRNAVPQEQMRVNLIAPNFIRTNMTEAAVPFLEKAGLEFAKLDDAVDAVVRLAADDEINGRAIAVLPTGLVDLRDDHFGHDAGEEVLTWFKSNNWV